ncbi:MAG: c-type cytochrome [Thiobacillus sp.]|nr:c-type cytochrome [Gammaproteobacteria bacterium]MBU4499583.1 c-type cytochrome [Gammaproteobacteria bacterium]MDO9010166.1 c-type cytochrome [Thiobacillus sp.]MDP3125620.1 c-type cytochrome [Thiobacillus sp.]
MADSHAKMTQATPLEVIISIVAGLIAPLLAILLVVMLVLSIQDNHKPDTTSEAAQQATAERIKPFAQLAALDANAPKVEKSGQAVYDAVCTSCHAAGALGAPKFDNKGDWGPRIAQGYDTLVKHAIEGIRQMPPRGGDGDLSDVEVARAVAYMANSSGAGFTEPEAAAPAATAETATPAAAEASPVAAEAAAPAAAAATPAPAAKAAVAKADPTKGKAVYTANCAVCHAAGVAGAPKLNDKAAWAPRLGQGFDGLYKSALNGKNAMPAKGGNPALPDADLANAVGYMLTEAGGKL